VFKILIALAVAFIGGFSLAIFLATLIGRWVVG
jgi:hypothetical protein